MKERFECIKDFEAFVNHSHVSYNKILPLCFHLIEDFPEFKNRLVNYHGSHRGMFRSVKIPLIFKEVLRVRLFRQGNSLVEKIRLVPEDIDGNEQLQLSDWVWKVRKELH